MVATQLGGIARSLRLADGSPSGPALGPHAHADRARSRYAKGRQFSAREDRKVGQGIFDRMVGIVRSNTLSRRDRPAGNDNVSFPFLDPALCHAAAIVYHWHRGYSCDRRNCGRGAKRVC
jgi:hypothetical protein